MLSNRSTRPCRPRHDLLQAASLADYFARTGQIKVFNAAWRDALSRGKGWHARALQRHKALLSLAPDVAVEGLWAK